MEEVKVIWSPFSKQKRALSCPAMEMHYGGAAGGGKSETLLIKALNFASMEGTRGLLLRRKIVDLQKAGAIIDRSKTLFKGRGKYNDQKKRWYFPKNSIIEFGHCQAAKDLDNYYSAQYDFIGIDQVEQFTSEMYTFFFSRLRTTNPKVAPQIMSSSNPVGIGRAWLKQRFWIGEKEANKCYPITEDIIFPDGEKKSMTYYRAFIPSRVFDNPHIIKNDPMYLLRLQQLPEEKRKALMDGDWNAFEGAFFSEWNERIHVREGFNIPQHWKRTISFDWGFNDPTCVLWFTEDPVSGQIYCYRELKLQRTLDVDVMRAIWDLSKNENIYCIYYPWDLDRVDDQTGVSKRERMQNVWKDLTGEIPYMKVAVNNRAEGWDAVRYLLGSREDGKPRFQFFKNCKYLMESIPNQIYSDGDNKVEDLDTDGDDHGVDALRYFAISYRNFFEKPQEKKPHYKTLPVDVGGAIKYANGEYRMKPYNEIKSPAFAWLGE